MKSVNFIQNDNVISSNFFFSIVILPSHILLSNIPSRVVGGALKCGYNSLKADMKLYNKQFAFATKADMKLYNKNGAFARDLTLI